MMEAATIWSALATYAHEGQVCAEVPDNLALLFGAAVVALREGRREEARRLCGRFTALTLPCLAGHETALDLGLDLAVEAVEHGEAKAVNELIVGVVLTLTSQVAGRERDRRLYRLATMIGNAQRRRLFPRLAAVPGIAERCDRDLLALLLPHAAGYPVELGRSLFCQACDHHAHDSAIRHTLLDLHGAHPERFPLDGDLLQSMAAANDARLKHRVGMLLVERGQHEPGLELMAQGLAGCADAPSRLALTYVQAVTHDRNDLALRSLRMLAGGRPPHFNDLVQMAPHIPDEHLPWWLGLLDVCTPAEDEEGQCILLMTMAAHLRAGNAQAGLAAFDQVRQATLFDELAPRITMHLIEALVAAGRAGEAAALFARFPGKTAAHETYYTVLRIRAARRCGDQDSRRNLIEAAPEACSGNEVFLLEKAWLLLEQSRWPALFQLMGEGDYNGMALRALQMIALEKNSAYAKARQRFDFVLLQPSLAGTGLDPNLLQQTLAVSALYAFAVSGHWQRVSEILEGLPFREAKPGPIAFYFRLARIHGERATDERVLDLFEQCLGLGLDVAEIGLLIGVHDRTIRKRSVPEALSGRVAELAAYLRFLCAALLEAPLAAIRDAHPQNWETISAALPQAEAGEILAFLNRCRSLNTRSKS